MRRKLTEEELAEQGQAMREMREAAGLSDLEMALRLDVDPKTIANWETGKTNPGRIGVMAYESVTRKTLRSLRRRVSSCSSVEQLDLFSPTPQAADLSSGGVVWEFSGRMSAATPTNAENVASGLQRQLVA